MATLVVFGLGLGNLGPQRRKRVPQSEWVSQLNDRLRTSGVAVVNAYGHTGNFVLRANLDVRAAARSMVEALGTPCALLTQAELRDLVRGLNQATPQDPDQGFRCTPGATLLAEGSPTDGSPHETAAASYTRLARHIVGVTKRDVLTETGTLDRRRRSGGWGAIAGHVERELGGRWTARSIRTLEGVLGKADCLGAR